MASQQLYSYLGRAALWRNIRDKLAAKGARLAPCDDRALKDLCAGVTWMQRVPPALLASYRALYVILRGSAAEAEEEINRDILRTVRAVAGLLLDFSDGHRSEFAGSINRVLNALAHVDDMGYCQGQNYVVDVMMKAGLPERETFCLFLYLLRQGHLHGIYRKEVPMLAGYMDKFEEQLRLRLPKLAAHFEREHYPPPLYALEWITTLFGLAARPLISLVALDLFLAGARNPVLRLCVSLLGGMEDDLLALDQEGLLKEFRARAVAVDAEEVIVRAFLDGGGQAAEEARRARAGSGSDRYLGWSTGPDYLLVLRSRHCQTVGLVELREEAKNGLLVGNSTLQDALLAVTRSLGWGCLRTCWLDSCLEARSDHERYRLANESLRFVIAHGGHCKAAAFMLGVGGADANGVDARLLSPLHLVALYNRPDIARVLLMCGASPRLVGGMTRAAAARGGKLLSPLEMAEEACTEGGELDEAGVAVGPGALFVLRGLVCLQCNLKLGRPPLCGTCKLSFCSSCLRKHFCLGRLDLPRGVAEAADGGSAKSAPGATAASLARGRDSGRRVLWGLGSAIGDDWEALFTRPMSGTDSRSGASSTGVEDDWKPGGLRRAGSGASKSTEDDGGGEEGGLSDVPWTTMSSVVLGKWERRPRIASPKDRDRLLDNSATFVRACFPAHTWLQYHMEEDMGLSLGSARSKFSWGGPFRGLSMRREYFNSEVMRVSSSTKLHRRMSWVMAESGVPWEDGDAAWCCPECFILFSLNVFRHHCRGCGNIYCSAHAPQTPIPPDNKRSLKLCWSCVLEGAIPLPSPADNDDVSAAANTVSLSPTTARGIANTLSPTAEIMAAASGAVGGAYVAPQPPSPTYRHDDDDERQTSEPGFLSALVSLIEVVAASPGRSRSSNNDQQAGAAQRDGRGRGTSRQRERSPSPCRLTKVGGTPARPPAAVTPTRSRQRGGGGAALPPSHSPASTTSASRPPHRERADEPPDGLRGGGAWRSGSGETSPHRSSGAVPPQHQQHDSGLRVSIVAPPPKEKPEQRGFGSSVSTASSTEAGDEYEYHRGGLAGSRGGVGALFDSSENSSKPVELGFQREPPAELGFPSERPWGHGFGSP